MWRWRSKFADVRLNRYLIVSLALLLALTAIVQVGPAGAVRTGVRSN